MNGDNVVIVIEGGAVRDVYSDNTNIQAVIVDIDNKNVGSKTKQNNLLNVELENSQSLQGPQTKTDELFKLKQALQQDVTLVIPNNKTSYNLLEASHAEQAGSSDELANKKITDSNDALEGTVKLEKMGVFKIDTTLDKIETDKTKSLPINNEVSVKGGPLYTTKEKNSSNDKLPENSTFALKADISKVDISKLDISKSDVLLSDFSKTDKNSQKFLNAMAGLNIGKTEAIANKSENKLLLDSFDSVLNKGVKLATSISNLAGESQQQVLNTLAKVKQPSAQSNLQIDTSLLSMTKLEPAVIDTPQIQKPDINASFTQGLNMKQNFAPNLAMRIQWMLNQSLSSAEIMMDPPDMGPLTVQIKQHKGEPNVMFQVAQSGTKELVEENLSKLKEMLEQQGIDLGEASVEQQKDQSEKNEENANSSANSQAEGLDNSQKLQNETITLQTDKLVDVYS